MELLFVLILTIVGTYNAALVPTDREDFCELFENRAYLFHNREMEHRAAQRYCQDRGMKAVNVTSLALQKWLFETSQLIKPSVKWWVAPPVPKKSSEILARLPSNSSIKELIQGCQYLDLDNVFASWISDINNSGVCDSQFRVICQPNSKSCTPEEEKEKVTTVATEPEKVISESEQPQCKPYKGQGYLFHTEAMTQPDAEQHCMKQGMSLTVVYSPEHNKFLAEKAFQLKAGTPWWIGLKSKDLNSEFVWPDKTPLSFFTNWKRGSPQNTQIDPSCVSIDSSDNGEWSDTSCSQKFPFICETESESCDKNEHARKSLVKLSTGDMCGGYEGDGFVFHQQSMNYREAKNYCQNLGMQMVSVETLNQNKYVTETALSLKNEKWWLGLYRDGSSEEFKWTDSTPVTFAQWGDKEPKDRGSEPSCVIFGQSNNTGSWSSTGCEMKFPVICESDSARCEENLDSNKNVTEEKLNSVETKEAETQLKVADQDEAESYCASLGMNLTSIYSTEQNKWVRHVGFIVKRTEEWICVNEETDQKITWRSENTEQLDKLSSSKATDSSENKEICHLNGVTKVRGEWRRMSCLTQHDCPQIPPTCIQKKQPALCRKYGRKSFYFVANPMTYRQAQRFCTHNGMSLATVYSRRHNKWFVRTANKVNPDNKWWIGLSDREREGRFKWISGSFSRYQNWQRGEPNNIGNEDCVELLRWRDYTWNDAQCNNRNSFICESNSRNC